MGICKRNENLCPWKDVTKPMVQVMELDHVSLALSTGTLTLSRPTLFYVLNVFFVLFFLYFFVQDFLN